MLGPKKILWPHVVGTVALFTNALMRLPDMNPLNLVDPPIHIIYVRKHTESTWPCLLGTD